MPEAQQQRYRVLEKLASGGMAEVFLAESAGLEGFKKRVAIKRVLPHLSEKKRFISMFLDEARLSAHLSHSNCVQVFDIGVGDNAYFIVMEYVDGADLKAILESLRKRGREIPPEDAVFICIKICEGLCYAHELKDSDGKAFGVVHRDVSPPNVLITKNGEIKIVDFGLARASTQLEKSEPGIIKGKFSYLCPEAALGKDVDHRADIFAVGIILWEMLSGRRLFQGDTDFATVKLVQQAIVPPITKLNPKTDATLESILGKALARDPAQRFQSARELAIALNRWIFQNGKAVGSFSIAEHVQTALRDKARSRPPQPSIIDKLIAEALLEFTSLREGGSSGMAHSTDVAGTPLSLDRFDEMNDWSKEISIQEGERTSDLPQMGIQAGNLAALEDDEEGPPIRTVAEDEPVSEVGLTGSLRPTPIVPADEAAPAPKKGSGGAVAVVVTLVLLAMAAGAYYTGLIPGHGAR
jgi:eukaryotic-like serine/threonine-protein kinase